VTKKGSAVADIENSEGGDRAGERDRELALAEDERETLAGAHRRPGIGGLRPAARVERQRSGGHDEEGTRVEGEREPQQVRRAERAADERARREADRADGLHQPVGPRGVRLGSGRRGDERELGGLGDGDAEAEQGHERQQGPETVRAGEHGRDSAGLTQRGDDEDPAVLEAVDDRARDA